MGGFLRRRVPVVLRRAVGLVPAVVILGAGADPMGPLVNRRRTTVVALVCAILVIALNALLVVRTFT